jgi:hypothetical protein
MCNLLARCNKGAAIPRLSDCNPAHGCINKKMAKKGMAKPTNNNKNASPPHLWRRRLLHCGQLVLKAQLLQQVAPAVALKVRLQEGPRLPLLRPAAQAGRQIDKII